MHGADLDEPIEMLLLPSFVMLAMREAHRLIHPCRL